MKRISSSDAARALQALRKERKGAKRKPARCPCGEMTLARAKARYHKCEKPSLA